MHNAPYAPQHERRTSGNKASEKVGPSMGARYDPIVRAIQVRAQLGGR
jgi:hypothetical protein